MSTSFALSPALVSYLGDVNPPEHPVLARCREETARHPMARMQISAEQGAFMQMLVRLTGARLAVEVGVFTGYSALATALALRANHGPGARLFAFDVSEDYTALARGYWAEAKVEPTIDLRIAPAADSLDALLAEGYAGKIDLMFVDADKTGYGAYYEKGLALLRTGGLMLFDNMLWGGSVADPADQSADTVAIRAVNEMARDDDRVETALVAVGDGVLMVRKR